MSDVHINLLLLLSVLLALPTSLSFSLSSLESSSIRTESHLLFQSSQQEQEQQQHPLKREEERQPQQQKDITITTTNTTTTRTIRYRARVAYDGSGYNGFQFQPNKKEMKKTLRTVQGEIENVLARRFHTRKSDENNNHDGSSGKNTKDGSSNYNDDNQSSFLIRVVAAGRTDSGVHARGQAVHFDLLEETVTNQHLNETREIQRLQYILNRMLPPDIRLWSLSMVPSSMKKQMIKKNSNNYGYKIWNVMFETIGKLYSYRICLGPVMDPLLRHNRWHVPTNGKPVNIQILQRILNYYKGTHNFRAFANTREPNAILGDATRTIYSVHLIHETDDEEEALGGGDYYRIDFHLQGALYKMVRNMVGTAIEVSREYPKKCPKQKQEILDESNFLRLLNYPQNDDDDNDGNYNNILTRDDNPCKPAPACGLTLEWVYYDEEGF